MEYLYETYGVARLQKVWMGGSKSIRKVYGKRLSKLEAEYRSDLLKHRPAVHDADQPAGPRRRQLLPEEEVPHQHGIDPR